ncbi:reverse transcriptase-like protein, partial [Leptotrombidium deliense]
SSDAEYSRHQRLFKDNRSVLFQEIKAGHSLSNSSCLDPSSAYDYFKTQFDPQREEVIPSCCERAASSAYSLVWSFVDTTEIEQALKDMRNTAPGPDGLTASQLLLVPSCVMQLFITLFLHRRNIPDALRHNRTTLIPKTHPPSDNPSDYRPITVAGTLLRCFNKIIAKRVMRAHKFSNSQRGFIPTVDGCFENTLLLDHLIRDARRRHRTLYVAILDIRKAFDSVSWPSIVKALNVAALPPPFIDYIINSYSNTTTEVSKDAPAIIVRQGVKQGDPLSPFLFNLVVDQLLSSFPAKLGYAINSVLCTNLAFADDTVLVANSKVALDDLLQRTTSFLADCGMCLNPLKCRTLAIVADGKKKTTYCDSAPFLKLDNCVIPALRPTEFFRYLGIMFNASGKSRPNLLRLEQLLRNLQKIKLKCNQKLVMLRDYVLPSFIHELTLGRCNANLLTRFDSVVRQFVKRLLRLPESAPNAIFYVPVKKGGLGLPLLRKQIAHSLLHRFSAASQRSNPVFCAFASSSAGARLQCAMHRLAAYNADPLKEATTLRSLAGFSEYAEFPASNHWFDNVRTFVREKSDKPAIFGALVFGSRGSVLFDSVKILTTLGLTSKDISDLSLSVMRSSLKIYKYFRKDGT